MTYAIRPDTKAHVLARTSERHRGAVLFTLAAAALAFALVNSTVGIPTLLTVAEREIVRRGPAPAAPTAAPVADVAPPPVELLHSAWISQSGGPSLALGETAAVVITFRNTGSTPWIRGSAAELRLGIVGEDASFHERGFAVDWLLPTRPAAQREPIVQAGGVATFMFDVRGAEPGSHRIDLRPVVDGVGWLEDEGVHVIVNVR